MSDERPPQTPDDLHEWIRTSLEVTIARTPLIEHHQAPFDYLCHTFFEGTQPARPAASDSIPRSLDPSMPSPDCTLWANRGGGKTFLGAIATLLDLVFKPGVQVRILGGSLEQSQRMHEHLRRLFALDSVADCVKGKPTARRIALGNGSCVEVLAASQTSVRGTRVQKLRCDEVDLFDPEVWAAAQLTTRSMDRRGPWGPRVRGSIEALSTMHRPHGLMWNLVLGMRAPHELQAPPHPATLSPRHLFRWGLLDILEPCTDEHTCDSCSLHPECGGRAKLHGPGRDAGHISISDAVSMKSRVDRATWDAEMLCNRPRRTESVYPEFDPAIHVYNDSGAAPVSGGRIHIAGMDFGYRGDSVILLAALDADGAIRIEREHAASEFTLDQHIAVIHGWIESGVAPRGIAWIGADPAGRHKNLISGQSCFDLLSRAGFPPRARAGKVEDGIRLVRARLRPAAWRPALPSTPLTIEREPRAPTPDPDPASAGPRLFVHARCVKLIEALERYHYPPGRPDSFEPVKDGPDHACDALRYLVVNLDRPYRAEARGY